MSVKVGILSFAHMHATSYASALNILPEAEFVGIADEDPQRGQEMAKQFGTKFFPSYEALIESVDAVIITSENVKHKELTLMAARAGKHVLCEKPIATTVEDGQAMIDACRENGVKLMIAFPCRYSPSIIRAKEQVESGVIGSVLAIKGTNHGQMPGGWFIEKEKSGGGAVIDHTVHVTDLMRWIMKSEPTEVYAEISNEMHHRDFDDVGMLTVTFDNGVFSTLDTSWSRPKSYPIWGDVTMELLGTEGMVGTSLFSQNIAHYSDETMRVNWIGWGGDTDCAMVKDFVTSVAEETPMKITGEDGLQALKVALAAYKSRETGGPVKID
jgi:predicted dehydrogenase